MNRPANSPCRRLAIVGRGRVGTALAEAFSRAGIDVEGPLGRGEAADSDVVLLCVPDAEIAKAAAAVDAPFVGHTSGATPLGSLQFALHPLQTITGPGTALTGAGCAIAGSTPEALELARGLAEVLGMEAFEIRDADRAAYHASASIASNYLVTLEWMAERIAASAGLEPEAARRMLAPLVRQTVENWAELGPERALTGPVARGDEVTVARQRKAIADAAPDLLEAFDALTDATRSLSNAKANANAKDVA
jgi:predicted short-subunit dehydrogenase-like oxidoreductase (DUF2520 family)